MTKLQVKYLTVVDALGQKKTGWTVVENGRPGYISANKEAAIRQANATAHLRIVNGIVPVVEIEEEAI